MVLGLGHQPLSAKGAQGAAVHLPSSMRSRMSPFLAEGFRAGCLGGAKGPEASRTKRYVRQKLKVLAFTTESLVKHESSQADSLAHRPGVVRYRFVVPQYVTTFGQTLRVVGSLPELGEWNPQMAPTMTWSDGHQWSLECALPQRPFEFKITVFEGHGVKWEGGSNRVVHADEDEDGDIPVEIVVWLTCNFNATTSTQLQLAVPRARIQDAYETGKATLEFLRLRKSKLGQDTEQVSSFEERKRQSVELARLSEAVVEQSTVVHQLSDWLGHETRGNGNGNGKQAANINGFAQALDEDDQTLLLAIDSVRVPKVLRRISFVQSWNTGPAALPLPSTNGTSPAEAAPLHSPFLRGELDSRAEDLISAAEVLLQELKSSDATPQASVEWASLAEEAGQVAVAMEALGCGDADTTSNHVTQLQLRGLASVGSALASSGSSSSKNSGGSEAPPASPADVAALAGEDEDTPVLQVLAAAPEPETAEAEVEEGRSFAELAGVSGLGQPSHGGAAEEEALLAPIMAAASLEAVGGGRSGVRGAASDAAGTGAAAVGTIAATGGDVQVSAPRVERLSSAAGRVPPLEARAPEAHPLQRLAAQLKDAVRISGRPAFALKRDGWQPQLTGPQLKKAADPLQQQQQQLSPDEFVPSAAGNGPAQAAGSPQAQGAEQQQEPAPAGQRKWAPLKFNLRAFLESLFL
ncbi:hypothetical protein PLESTM_000249000 [Pleodorina starrii]|nr:hypothetical protein PLESTM_000249000 [Pleodorina starrii]